MKLSLSLALACVGTATAFMAPQPALSRPSAFALSSTKEPRHDVGAGVENVDISPEVEQLMQDFQQHQSEKAVKLDFATDVRTLIEYNHGFAVMSTFSKQFPEFPGGSVVGFAVLPDSGEPVFCFSGMSSHTQDLLANTACSLTIASKQFKGAADGRVNLMGHATLIHKTEQADLLEQAKASYQKKHPGAFWTNFGDFNWFRMTVEKVRFVGGFARAGSVTAEQYANANPDAISEFGPAVAQHMNEDHMSATIQIVKTAVPGLDGEDEALYPEITAAEITSLDSLGMFVKVTRTAPVAPFLPPQFKVRVPFPRPAEDRKDVKTLIVEMTQAAAASSTPKEEEEAVEN